MDLLQYSLKVKTDSMNIMDHIKKINNKLPKSKGVFLLALGVIGLLFILMSDIDFKKEEKDMEAIESVKSITSSDEYISNLEERMKTIISDMLGSSPVSVMITLESGIEYVFADEQKNDAELKKDQSSLKTEQTDSTQKSYVVVEDSQGNEKAVVVTEIMPEIRGVVVVCENGEKANVSDAVKRAVKSALAVSEDKICVVGRH